MQANNGTVAREITRSAVPLKYDKGTLTCDQAINVMGPRGPEQYQVNWKVTWDVGTKVGYKGTEYVVEGYELAHDNQGGLWPDVVLKDAAGLLLRVDPIATMDGNPPTFVHNLSTIGDANVQYVESAEIVESNVDSGA